VIETLAPMQRAVNDTLFKEFSGADMKALGRFARALLDASQEGLAQAKRPVQSRGRHGHASRRRAGPRLQNSCSQASNYCLIT